MIGIIILNYNTWKDTISCIESIEKVNTSKVKIIVVDNASVNLDSVPGLHDYFLRQYKGDYVKVDVNQQINTPLPRITLFVNASNEGYAKGNNLGLKLFERDNEIDKILILNNDTIFIEDFLPILNDFYDNQNNIGVVSPLMVNSDGQTINPLCARYQPKVFDIILSKLFLQKNYFGIISKINSNHLPIEILLNSEDPLEIETPSGACFLMSKSLFRQIEYFDPNTFLYFEEDIICSKLKDLNLRSYILPSVKFVHYGAHSTSSIRRFLQFHAYRDSSSYYLRYYRKLTVLQLFILKFAELIETLHIFRMKYLSRDFFQKYK